MADEPQKTGLGISPAFGQTATAETENAQAGSDTSSLRQSFPGTSQDDFSIIKHGGYDYLLYQGKPVYHDEKGAPFVRAGGDANRVFIDAHGYDAERIRFPLNFKADDFEVQATHLAWADGFESGERPSANDPRNVFQAAAEDMRSDARSTPTREPVAPTTDYNPEV